MYYIDSQRTITRRGSSLVTARKWEYEVSTGRSQSAGRLFNSDSTSTLVTRASGSVKKELITMMFESMLDSIVKSWEVIPSQKMAEPTTSCEFGKSSSELALNKKRRKPSGKMPKGRKSQSKSDLEQLSADPLQTSWWSSPDERAIIHFLNGNMYEGNISMKCMNGEGRYQWADGTVYLGQFKDNEINGKGQITWKDDTWYEGDFVGNVRHGKGLYVDSRKQRSYTGGWHNGTKHGEGVIHYSSKINSYDGEWVQNVRHGFGSREYNAESGYRGDWDDYIREGKGLMIWPNHDFYRGEWRNGAMSGFGIYIWNATFNKTMSLSSMNAYRGQWFKGERHGYGILNLGLNLGSHYKGGFKNNKKHGVGKLVTNNGLILENKELFTDDNLSRAHEYNEFNICDDTVGLWYHVDKAYKNIDKQDEVRASIIKDYVEYNTPCKQKVSISNQKESLQENEALEELMQFEINSLEKALKCYEIDLKNIYYEYATICNTQEIIFSPVMIRLYLWQFYYDCNVHQHGLNLVEIDNMYHNNPEWLSRNAHDPFEKIYFWQFTHTLITVAIRLYAKRQLPGVKPDTIVANAFKCFMNNDVLPGVGHHKGRLVNGYGCFIPLKATYELYGKIGEPHTVRMFLTAVKQSPHCTDTTEPFLKNHEVIEVPDDKPIGRNLYVYGDEMTYITDEPKPEACEVSKSDNRKKFSLFTFRNLETKTIIKTFAQIFPYLYVNGRIVDLETEITFYEFFEAFVLCAEESLQLTEEEMFNI